MSLGDYYLPEPPVRCPICAEPVFRWEGFAGANIWLTWQEGLAAPELGEVIASQRAGRDDAALAALRLPDGSHSIYGACMGGHRLLAHLTVEGGVWNGMRVADAEGSAGTVVRGPWLLWWTWSRLVSLATTRPTERQVVPATVTALGLDAGCILLTRRPPAGDGGRVDDQWWVVDLGREEAHGPLADDEVRPTLASLGLEEPAHMTLPEDLGRPPP